MILQRDDGKFVPTLPIEGRRTLFNFDEFLWMGLPSRKLFEPEGFIGAGYYVSNAADHALLHEQYPKWSTEQIKLYLGFFSEAHLALQMQGKGPYAQRHYLSGPDGSLIKYESVQPGSERKLIDVGITRGSEFGATFTMIDTLARIGKLVVLVANPQWGGTRGRVPAKWTLGMPLLEHRGARGSAVLRSGEESGERCHLGSWRGCSSAKGHQLYGVRSQVRVKR